MCCQETFTQDNNLGLVKQVVSSQTRSNIRRLTRTFITLSLSDLAHRVGLSSPALVEAELVKMIQSGSIHATISHQVGRAALCWLLLISLPLSQGRDGEV